MVKLFTTRVTVLFVFLLIIGIFYIGFTLNRVKEENTNEALKMARTAAAAISENNILELKRNAEDLNNPPYLHLKETLKKITRTNPETRFAYLLQIEDNRIIILVDSEPESSKDYSPPGQEYTEAPQFDNNLINLINKKGGFIYGPYTDQWGTRISAIVPLTDPHTGRNLALLGIDYSAASWKKRLMAECFRSSILIILSIVLSWFVLLFIVKNRKLKKEIDHREKMEAILEESHHIAQMGSWEYDIQQNKTIWSENCYNLYGLNKHKVTPSLEVVKNTIHPEDHKIIDHKLRKIIITREPASFEFRVIQPDGRTRWLQNNIVPDFHNNKLIKLKGINIDISERKRMEKELTEAEMMASSTVDALPSHIAIIDEKGTILYVNYKWKSFAIQNSLISNQIGSNYLQVCDQAEGLFAEEAKIMANGIRSVIVGERNSFELEYPCHSPNENRWFIARVSKFAGKGPLRIVVAHENITHQKLAEIALTHEKKRLSNLISNLPGMVYRCRMDSAWTMLYISEPSYRITGYYPEELINNHRVSFNDLILPEEDQVIRQKWREALLHHTSFEHQYKIRDAHGKIKWLWERGNCILDENGNCSHLEGYIEDITEQKRFNEAIRSKEEQIRLLLDSTAEAIYGIDNNGNCTFINQSAIRMLGYTDESELIGQNIHLLIHHSHADYSTLPQEECKIHKALSLLKKTHVTDEVFWRANHTCFPVEYWSYPIVKENQIIGAVLTFFDITNRHKAEAALKQSEENFRNSIENSPLGIRIVTEKGETIYTNKSFLNIFGYDSLEEFRSQPKVDYYSPESYKLHQIRKKLRKEGLSSEPEYEITIFRKDGGIRHLKVIRKEIQWDARSQYQVIYQDITLEKESLKEKKKYELELVKAKEKAEESDRLKTAFLANMSHEIRTPMNGILGFADLLKDPKLSGKEQQEYLEIIEQSGQRMLNIINDIVDISKIEAGQMEVKAEETSINLLLNHLWTFFRPETNKKGLQLNFLPDNSSNPGPVVLIDRTKLSQVMSNLIKNALKFTRNGTIDFGYTLKEGFIEFFVKDTGPGIPVNLHNKIFERFIQGETSLSRNYEGAGLGLSISKAYVEMLGGTMWLESEEGNGATFFFTIPLSGHQAIKQQKENSQPELHHTEGPTLNILVAENDEYSLKFIRKIMEKLNVRLFTAQNGQEAVDIVKSVPKLDMVLMDLKMPVLDGYEATGQIKKIYPRLPVIAQTAYAFSDDERKARQAGCDDFIAKPIKRDSLIRIIRQYAARH